MTFFVFEIPGILSTPGWLYVYTCVCRGIHCFYTGGAQSILFAAWANRGLGRTARPSCIPRPRSGRIRSSTLPCGATQKCSGSWAMTIESGRTRSRSFLTCTWVFSSAPTTMMPLQPPCGVSESGDADVAVAVLCGASFDSCEGLKRQGACSALAPASGPGYLPST